MSKNQIGGKLGIADLDLAGKRVLMRYVVVGTVLGSHRKSLYSLPLCAVLVHRNRLITNVHHIFSLYPLLSVDFNVPQDKNGAITNTQRIVETLPTIRYALEHGSSDFGFLRRFNCDSILEICS